MGAPYKDPWISGTQDYQFPEARDMHNWKYEHYAPIRGGRGKKASFDDLLKNVGDKAPKKTEDEAYAKEEKDIVEHIRNAAIDEMEAGGYEFKFDHKKASGNDGK